MAPSPLPPLTAARRALAQGDWASAARIAEQVARADPRVAEAHFVLGMALAETGHAGHALGRIEAAVALAPDTAEYRAQLARLLILLRRDGEARMAAQDAARLASDDPLVLDTIGCVLARLGEHGAALPLFERAVAIRPDTLAFRFNYASSLGFFGEVAAAAAQYEAMIARDPGNGLAHYGLSALRRATAQDNRVARIEAALTRAQGHEDRVRLHYAAAKEREDLGHHAAAFAHLETAGRAHKAKIGYDPATDAALVEAIERAFARPDFFTGEGLAGESPIFVVGLPRTGTTLVDRILAAHPDVTSLGELQAMPLAIKRLSQSPSRLVLDRDTVARMAPVSPRLVGQAYIDQARAQAGAQDGRRLLDKFPLNALTIGFIARALPDARIVCLRRHPMDSVWSTYKHLFALGSPYYGWSYDPLDCARYYAQFDRLMALWRDLFPGRVLELGYEALIDDQEAQTRALLAHCGLTWDAACLSFHASAGAVATPSAQQVRRPLNRDSVGRWRAYAKHLAPVVAWFGETAIGDFSIPEERT